MTRVSRWTQPRRRWWIRRADDARDPQGKGSTRDTGAASRGVAEAKRPSPDEASQDAQASADRTDKAPINAPQPQPRRPTRHVWSVLGFMVERW
jgi:hypothetical protein